MTEKQHNKHDDNKQVNIDRELVKQGLPEEENPNHGSTEVDTSMSHRSNSSIPKGGENNERGNPQPGYYTEAPGHQGGGKR